MYYLKNCINSSLNPSPHFDTIWYLNQNNDVKESGMNPFVHYIKHGIKEHRLGQPLLRKNNDKFNLKNDNYNPCFFKTYENLLNEDRSNESVKIAIFLKSDNGNFLPTEYIRLIIPFYHLFQKKNISPYLFNKSDIEKLKHNHTLLNKKLFDIIITQRDCIDLEMSKLLIETSKNWGTKLIYETDDDLLNIDEKHPDFDEFTAKKESIQYLISNSNVVITSTENLKEELSKFNENVIIIKNSLNECLNENKNKRDSKNIKIGYMGTFTHEDDLKMIKPIINEIKETSSNVTFEIIGGTTEELKDVKKINIPREYQKYPYFIKWLKAILDWDIAIAPLANNKLNNSKSEIKYLEYASLGIAGIYSNVGAYSDAINDGINGMLIENNAPQEWKDAILNLIENNELRKSIVKNSMEDIRKKYSIDNMVELWSKVIDDSLDENKKRLFNENNPYPLFTNNNFSKDYSTILNSGLFDWEFYLNNYCENYSNPVYHYLSIGVFEGFNPTEEFDTKKYAKMNQIDINRVNPFVHYIFNYGNKLKFNQISKSNINNIINNLEKEVSVIIPIYNAYEDIKKCIESVLKNSTKKYELILINDCSTDKRIDELLKTYENYENTKIIINETNLGFVSSVNIGLQNTKNDVILLNSDTIVTPRWLEKLTVAAYSDKKIATVTPLSNDAGAFSVPKIGIENPIPPELNINSMANIVEKVSNHKYMRVPTGNGYCMFIKREAIDDIGYFDDETFKRGYGEENDFCMRLKQKGWEHIIDDTTYIFHNNGSSFLNEKNELLIKHTEILKQKFPTYETEVNAFINSDILKEMQNNIEYGINNYKIEKYDKKRELYLIECDKIGKLNRITHFENEIFILNNHNLYKLINGKLLKIKKLDNYSLDELLIKLSIDIVHYEYSNLKTLKKSFATNYCQAIIENI